MIRKVTLHNYMSHGHSVIELAEGLTALVGPNNCGKSAVVDAIRTVCDNALGSYMMRHGERECSVVIETAEGDTVEWRRRGDVVTYIINGKAYDRLNGGVPDEVHKVLRMPRVQGTDLSIHIALQKSPIFLLDQSGAQRAMFFCAGNDAALLMSMQKRHRQRWSDHKKTMVDLARDRGGLQMRLAVLEPIGGIESRLAEAQTEYDAIERSDEHIASLGAHINALTQMRERVEHAAQRHLALADLSTPPELADSDSLARLILHVRGGVAALERQQRVRGALANLPAPPPMYQTSELETICRALQSEMQSTDRCGRQSRALQDLAAPPTIEQTDALEQLIGNLAKRQQQTAAIQKRNACLARLAGAPLMEDAVALESLTERLTAAASDMERAGQRERLLGPLSAPPILNDPAPLQAMLAAIETQQKAVGEHLSAKLTADEAFVAAGDALRAWAAANPLCPTCGAQVDSERLLLAGVHEHEQP